MAGLEKLLSADLLVAAAEPEAADSLFLLQLQYVACLEKLLELGANIRSRDAAGQLHFI